MLEAINATGGFSFVFAGLTTFLEHGVELRLTENHDPNALVESMATGHHPQR